MLRPIELFRAIHEQTQERFLEIFRMKKGEIAFARGVRSHEETFPLGVDTYELIGRGIRDGYSYEELEAMLAPCHEEVLEPVASPPVRLEMFRLPEAEALVIEAVTGKTTLGKLVAELTSDGRADPEEILRAVFLALACELLQEPEVGHPSEFHQEQVNLAGSRLRRERDTRRSSEALSRIDRVDRRLRRSSRRLPHAGHRAAGSARRRASACSLARDSSRARPRASPPRCRTTSSRGTDSRTRSGARPTPA